MGLNLLETYTGYLLVQTGQATATGLSSLLDGQVSHDQVTRFYIQETMVQKNFGNM